MTSLRGTGALIRLALRRDRVMLPAWTAVFVVMAASSASATTGFYPTVADRVQAARSINGTPSLVALYGKIYDPTSLGEVSLIKLGGFGAAMVAILAIVLVVRHTRGEEEAGRLELVGSTVVGRRAGLAAALIVVTGATLLLGLLTAAGLSAAGLPTSGSVAFGLAWAASGMAFAGLAAVVAQLTSGARAAVGLSCTVLAGVYVLRAIGDTAEPGGPTWASWASPIGWGQQVRPFAQVRWWALALLASFAVVTAITAFVLAGRRDLGAGLLPDRAGPATAGAMLRSPLALAWRLQRATLLGWMVGFVLLGFVLGNIATNLGGIISSPQAREFILKLGGEKGLTDAFLAAELGFAGIFASAYGIQAALRLRAEEEGRRAEPVLATAVGRVGWAAGHVVVALLGTAVLLLLTGLAAGVSTAAQLDEPAAVGRVLAGAVVQVPAAWVLTGVAVAAFGLAPRASVVGWVALVVFLLLGELGPLLGLDPWLMDLSPYAHVPRLPGSPFDAVPVIGLTGVALVLVVAGLVGVRHRDLAA